MTSSDGESPLPKLDTKYTPFRNRNNAESKKRRRSSMASLAILQDEVEGPSNRRFAFKGKSTFDRFVADASGLNIPLSATPRSRRLAKVLGEAGDRRLCFLSEENVKPTDRSRTVVPYRKELQRLTRSLYENPAPKSATSASTNLVTMPETCLGAPGLRDDFYSRLAAWSKTDLLAVAMNASVVYRNMQTQTISRVVAVGAEECVTCIKWNPTSSNLAVGQDCGSIRIYDTATHARLRDFKPRRERDFVGDLSFRDMNVFTVGFQSGHLRQYDMREPRPGKLMRSHRSRICGVEWNPDGRFLATGGGDGVVVCWDARAGKSTPITTVHGYDLPPPSSSDGDFRSSPEPGTSADPYEDKNTLTCRWRSRKHLSTVKALAWCPWIPDMLASGGGTKDGTIRFWDVTRGRPKRPVINTNSQVTSLNFSLSCRELASTHGFAFAPLDGAANGVLSAPRRHSILVHNYPRGELTGKVFDASHGRITHSCLSPDGTKVLTCGSDDSIRIFRIWGMQDNIPRDDDRMQSIIR